MSWFGNLVGSTIGKKLIMAVTGVLIFGFTVGHMAGNLQLFISPEMFNGYAYKLHDSHLLLWGTRFALLAAFPLHIWAGISLAGRNGGARGGKYGAYTPQASSLMSRTMKFGGIVLLLFVIYHIVHFTIRPGFQGDEWMTTVHGVETHNAHAMVVAGFSDGVMGFVNAGFYLLAVAALFLHLYHGVWSATQTLGFINPSWIPVRKTASAAFAVLVCGGFALVPILTSVGVTEKLNEAFAGETVAEVQVDSPSNATAQLK